MIKGIESSAEGFLLDLGRIEQRQAKVQRQIASGLRVNLPSDAPENVINILGLRSELSRVNKVDENLHRVRAEVDTAEAAVRVAVQIVERIRVLAAEAATGTAPNREASALQVQQFQEQLVALTRTASEGRYVFGGDLDTTMLYEVDATEPTGVRRLTDAANTRVIEDVNGTRFSISRSAHEIFDARDGGGLPAAHNVFNAVHSVQTAMASGDGAAVQTSLQNVIEALGHLNRQATFYGQAQTRLTSAITLTKQSILARTKELSENQDTDIAAALVDLTNTSVQQRAALGAHANLPRTTLFDVLG